MAPVSDLEDQIARSLLGSGELVGQQGSYGQAQAAEEQRERMAARWRALLGPTSIRAVTRALWGYEWSRYMARFGMPMPGGGSPSRYWARRVVYHRRKANRITRRKP